MFTEKVYCIVDSGSSDEISNVTIKDQIRKSIREDSDRAYAEQSTHSWLSKNNLCPIEMSIATRNLFVDEGLAYMRDNPTVPHTSFSSGDMLMSFTRQEDGSIKVVDCKIIRKGNI